MDDSGSRITKLPLASVAGAKRPVSEPGHHGVEWHGGDKGATAQEVHEISY